MKHFGHQHSLILNENYIAKARDTCNGCLEEIVSCKSFIYSCSSISNGSISTKTRDPFDALIRSFIDETNTSGADTDCDKFLLHKTCAELPQKIENPTSPNAFLVLFSQLATKEAHTFCYCNVCSDEMPWLYCSSDFKFRICVKCAFLQLHSLEDRQFEHAAHSKHPLALILRPSSFKCDACKVKKDLQDMSYKCSKCQFWIHKSCGDAPTSFQFPFHQKHPLFLAFSLPKIYHKFTQYCKLCNRTISRSNWLYYCPKCRFFAHFQCTRSSQIPDRLRYSEDGKYPNLVHLPAADESSVDVLVQKFIKAMSNEYYDDKIIVSTIKHRDHPEHRLELITINELNDKKDAAAAADDDIPLSCDGCVKPIETDSNQFYGCVPCNHFLHKYCALLPRGFKEELWQTRWIYRERSSEPCNLFFCTACGDPGNGTFFTDHNHIKLHIGCVALPKTIKHEAHPHPLDQIYAYYKCQCKACGDDRRYMHGCKSCSVHICDGCIMYARTVNHRWDSHPLRLIYEAGMVMTDHEHEFNCEYCSNDIDTNWWFYHCSVCDLSFHPKCLSRLCYRQYSNVKFGANIFSNKLHPHSLTFVLNKRFRRCKICGKEQLNEPVLECAPCNTILCTSCSLSLV